jgi:hypothetical protein
MYMKHAIYVGIDGTGPEIFKGNPDYEKNFSDSHVNFLYKNWVSPDPFYNRGPLLPGFDSGPLAELAYNEVVKRVDKYGEDSPIFLAGYSRGGACVIDTAMFLKRRKNLSVYGLILFDPVDRSTSVGRWFGRQMPIASSVKNVIQLRRLPACGSRESFGNCGDYLEDSSKTKPAHPRYPAYFWGTHGGVGGCPHEPKNGKKGTDFISEDGDGATFVTYNKDMAAKNQSRAWMQNLVFDLVYEAIT